MRTRAGVTAGVAVLSVLGSTAGHALVAGHPIPAAVLPRLGLLASLCFLLATQRLRPPVLVAALSLIQVGVHVVLTTAHSLYAAPAAPLNHTAHHTHMSATTSTTTAMTGMPGMAGTHGVADMPGMAGVSGSAADHRGADLGMLAMHLGAMLATLLLLQAAATWWERLVVALGRVLPRLPRSAGVITGSPARTAYPVLVTPRPERWLPGAVRRRGPPVR